MELQSCVQILNEWDIVAVRQFGRNVPKEVGFRTVDQARITTAISKLARNIFLYAGQVEVCIKKEFMDGKLGLTIVAKEQAPGIADTRRVLDDGYTTSGGLG